MQTTNQQTTQQTRDEIVAMISRLPETATASDIMEEIYFRIKVDKSLQRLDAGEGIAHEEIRERFKQCFD